MTTAQVLAIVRDRGLRIELRDGDRPVIVRPPGSDCAVTDPLLAVLRHHRQRIIDTLKRGCA